MFSVKNTHYHALLECNYKRVRNVAVVLGTI